MRAVIAAVTLAGCFHPTTDESCHYQCATQGTPCPSGLACVAGMCVAPGDTCSGDSVCGDGVHAPGEICYGAPVTIVGSDVVYDAQLADYDGDGDLDLVYLLADQYVIQRNVGGEFSTAKINGPSVFSRTFRALNLDGTGQAELVNAGTSVELWALDQNQVYARPGLLTLNAPEETVAMAVGAVSSTRPSFLVLTDTQLYVVEHDANLALTYAYGLGSLAGSRTLTAGLVDSDTLADVVIAQPAGIKVYRALGSGLAPAADTPVTGLVHDLATGDINHDGKLDLAYVQTAPTGQVGQLGVMLQASQGGGAFMPPTTIEVTDLAPALEVALIDGDLRADVIGLHGGATKAVVIALANADGTLADPVELPLSITGSYLNVNADYNGDGVFDIVVTDTNTQTIVILPSRP